TDSIVRVEATRVRQKLRSYYENEGRSDRVQIYLPSGTYVPRFELAHDTPPPDAPVPRVATRGNKRRAWWMAAAAAALFALSFRFAAGARQTAPRPEAVAAWREAVALFAQDPHVAQSQHGAPVTVERAIERLEFAVAKDPHLAGAWASLAEAYDYAYGYTGRDSAEDARRAEAAARRAVSLDPRLAAGHHMLGLVQWRMKWKLREAETSYRRALEFEPNNTWTAVEFADLLREMGRTEEAAELVRRTRALLPAIPQLAAKEAEIQLDLGRPDAAAAAA